MTESIEKLFSRVSRDVKETAQSWITPDRILRYLRRISETWGPSGSAWRTRGETLKELFEADGVLEEPGFQFHQNFNDTGNTLVITGENGDHDRPIWFMAHLDEISYLVKSPTSDQETVPLIPYCYHLLEEDREEPARVVGFDLDEGKFFLRGKGWIHTQNGSPYFRPESDDMTPLRPGDRILFDTKLDHERDTGYVRGHIDNAGAVASLAVAAPVLNRLDVPVIAAFPDEEEGPVGKGNQTFSRGSRRLIDQLPSPDVIIVSDIQQGKLPDGNDDSLRPVLGEGAVLSELSSQARGAVTPQPLYELIRRMLQELSKMDVTIQESGNEYTSRSDDINAFKKTPNVGLLGVPGLDRHFDSGTPRAHLDDLVNLSRSYAYFGFLPEFIRATGGYSRD